MGLPHKWHIVRGWLRNSYVPAPKSIAPKSECPKPGRFPLLSDYTKDPGPVFWKAFPSAPLPPGPTTKVDHKALKTMIENYSSNWPKSKLRRAWALYDDLNCGGSAYQSARLQPAILPNARSTLQHGPMLTEKIGEFIEKGFVKGPFFTPPFKDFRSNTLMAVERGGKIRPVINMSGPYGSSFNSNIDKIKLEKVRMSTAKAFSYKVRAAGKGAVMSKFDLKDAFKLIPAKPEDFRLQGFSWLGAFFVETQMIFGAIPSVSNFDRLGNTIVELTKTVSGLKSLDVCRTLDDIPVVSSCDSGKTEIFSEQLVNVCSFLKVPLAEDDPLKEKAFTNSTKGIVLGVGFDTQNSTWFFSEEKIDRIANSLEEAIGAKMMDLKRIQTLMGRLVDFSQMCPFVKTFTYTGYRFLASFEANDCILKTPPEEARKDWLICLQALMSAKKGLPLHKEPRGPTLGTLVFYSDAAGCKFDMIQGKRVCCNGEDKRGVACLELSNEEVKWYTTLTWPRKFLEEDRDEKGKFYGSKTSTLEAIGLLLPFVSAPERLRASNVLFLTDNIAVVHGWSSKGIRNDKSATIILRSVAILAAFLGCTVHVKHVPRISDKGASLADSLSRSSSTTSEVKSELMHATYSKVSGKLIDWLNDPVLDYDLPLNLLLELEHK